MSNLEDGFSCYISLFKIKSNHRDKQKGGEEEADTILFGKYQLCRVLGCGRSGTVFLARHMELNEYRAIKRVPKTFIDYELFRKEALILKGIRHEGIPIVYDLEEDDLCSYLIEEYLEGDSLYALVSESGHYSSAMTVRYGIQICHLVHIMHSTMPTPVLYLDLQPKNLLLCENTIKLIDFDHAVYADEAMHLAKRYGTVGCAAPEQYSGDVLDGRTDIYAIGAVLHYMLTGHFPGEAFRFGQMELSGAKQRRLMRIIRKCLQKEKNKRFQTAKELEEELRKLWDQSERGMLWHDAKGMEESLVISVAGSRHGVGTTHIAIGLTSYLQQCGMPAVYEEHNETGAVRQLADCYGAMTDQSGICRIRQISMMPQYGACVKLKSVGQQIRILDCGADLEQFLQKNADAYLLVCGAKPWEWETTREASEICSKVQGIVTVYNQFCNRLPFRLERTQEDIKGIRIPYFADPFFVERQTERVYQKMWSQWFGRQKGGKLRNLLSERKNQLL